MPALRRRDGVAARHLAVPPLQVQARLLRGGAAELLRRAAAVSVHPPVLRGLGSAAERVLARIRALARDGEVEIPYDTEVYVASRIG